MQDSEHELINKLQCCSIDTACSVPYKNKVIPAKLIKVLDGDTIQVIILTGDYPYLIKVRLEGIDAPETSLKGTTTALEKQAGLKVKEYVKELTSSSSIVYIKLTCIDKYGGRFVGKVYLSSQHAQKEKCLSSHLAALRYAKNYDGGKKSTWSVAELEEIMKS